MAALLIAMSIMGIMMTVAMPVWKQSAKREKEEELIFRGQQYQRAIGLFGRKFANAFPPNLDVLVDQKFLRKKYKDPITGEDFLPLTQAQATAPGTGGGSAARPGAQPTGAPSPFAGGMSSGTSGIGTTASGGLGTAVGGPRGGIIGVVSRSKDKSVRLYNGRSHYNEWTFIFTQQPTPGGPGVGLPGQQGRPGPGNRGPGGIGSNPRNPNNPARPNPNRPRDPNAPRTPQRFDPFAPGIAPTQPPRRPGR